MRLRIELGKLLVDLRYKYKFLEKLLFLPVLFMRPGDLLEFGRQNYARPVHVKIWSGKSRIEEGLEDREQVVLEKLPREKGRILVLASGGGREAVFLSQAGYDVTVIDYVPEMVEKAVENARKKGVRILSLVQDMSKLKVARESFDVVWLFRGMYSSILGRRRRLEMLRRIRKALKPQGIFVCQFFWKTKGWDSPLIYSLKKLLAFLTMGNFWYENGDVLWCNTEFMHFFLSEKKIGREFKEGGFKVEYLNLPSNNIRAEALLRKD